MNQSTERGFTLVEIMIVVAIIALLSAIAIPNVLRGRTSANEAAAVGSMRALMSSLEMYRSVNSTYPNGFNWRPLMYGGGCGAGVAPDPDFGPPSFCLFLVGAAADVVQGYTYAYAGGAAPASTFALTGTPQTAGRTGTRAFRLDETGQIRHCTTLFTGQQATATDPTIDDPPINC